MKKIIRLLGIIVLFSACEDKNDALVTAETAKKLPNVVEFTKMAEAIDNLNVSSKTSVEDQLVNYFDKEFSGDFKQEFQRMKRSGSTSLTAKGNNEFVTLDQQLDTASFTPVQKEYVSKITGLYPLDEESLSQNDELTVKNIKAGLLNIRNEVSSDSKLETSHKNQLCVYIDMQYATLDSVINYVEKAIGTSTGKWKISLRKIINIVVSVVVSVAMGAVLGSSGGPIGQIVGAVVAGGVMADYAIHDNRCIKICGVGWCNTSFFSCK